MKILKKAFTLVELVVVVAIIAILSAVSVATYVGLTTRARLNADENVCAQMNEVLRTNYLDETPAHVNEVKEKLADDSLEGDALVPGSTNHHFYWNENDSTIYLVNDESTFDVVFPTENAELVESNYQNISYYKDKCYRLDLTYYSITYEVKENGDRWIADPTYPTAVLPGQNIDLRITSDEISSSYIKLVYETSTETLSYSSPVEDSGYYTFTINEMADNVIVTYEYNCVLKGTKITLADGSSKNVEDLTLSDEILSYDYFTGSMQPSKLICVKKSSSHHTEVITLNLDNGDSIKIADYECIFDMEIKGLYLVDSSNYKDVVGKTIMVNNYGQIDSAKIISTSYEKKEAEFYTICPESLNYIGNNIVMSCSDPYLNYITPIGDDFKLDEEKYNDLINSYGQYTYEEFSDLICEEWFYNQRVYDYKIIEGMGFTTLDRVRIFVKEMVILFNENTAPSIN